MPPHLTAPDQELPRCGPRRGWRLTAGPSRKFAESLLAVLLLVEATAGTAATVQTVVGGLQGPSGLAIQPETGHVFVAESGRGRILRIVDGKPQEVATGFPQEAFSAAPEHRIGPLGLTFLNNDTLLVAPGGAPNDQERLYVVAIPRLGQPPVKATDSLALGPVSPGDSGGAAGDFFSVAKTGDQLYVTALSGPARKHLRMRMFDPDRLLERLVRPLGFLFTGWFLVASTMFLVAASLLAIMNREALSHDLTGLVRFELLVPGLLAFAFVALVHEFSHGLTCRHFGGTVHTWVSC